MIQSWILGLTLRQMQEYFPPIGVPCPSLVTLQPFHHEAHEGAGVVADGMHDESLSRAVLPWAWIAYEIGYCSDAQGMNQRPGSPETSSRIRLEVPPCPFLPVHNATQAVCDDWAFRTL